MKRGVIERADACYEIVDVNHRVTSHNGGSQPVISRVLDLRKRAHKADRFAACGAAR
jgi:hypothetical protein